MLSRTRPVIPVSSDQAAALAAATAELAELYGAAVEAEVETWPELTESQKADLSVILSGADGDDRAT